MVEITTHEMHPQIRTIETLKSDLEKSGLTEKVEITDLMHDHQTRLLVAAALDSYTGVVESNIVTNEVESSKLNQYFEMANKQYTDFKSRFRKRSDAKTFSFMCQAGYQRSVALAEDFRKSGHHVIDNRASKEFGITQFGLSEIKQNELGFYLFNLKEDHVTLGDNTEPTSHLIVSIDPLSGDASYNDWEYLLKYCSRMFKKNLDAKLTVDVLVSTEAIIDLVVNDSESSQHPIHRIKDSLSDY